MDRMMFTERRRKVDRRAAPHWAEWRWLFGGRRRRVRRANADRIRRIDWYPAPLLGAVVAISGLSFLDAAFTLHLLERGVATEANPFMASLLDTDVRLFVSLKTVLTGCCMTLLVLYSEVPVFGRFRTGHSLYALAGFYALLVGYELAMVAVRAGQERSVR